MYRLLGLLVKLAPPMEKRVKLQVPIERDFDASIVLDGRTATKRILDCDFFFHFFQTSLEAVQVPSKCLTMHAEVPEGQLNHLG